MNRFYVSNRTAQREGSVVQRPAAGRPEPDAIAGAGTLDGVDGHALGSGTGETADRWQDEDASAGSEFLDDRIRTIE